MTGLPETSKVTSHRRFELLDQLRGVAALLVVFDHLVGQYLRQSNQTWLPHRLVDHFVLRPLGIVQDLGAVGVFTFFLISGFVITAAAMRESPTEFAVRRVFRIYPPLWAALLLVWALDASSLLRAPDAPSAWSWPLSLTLANYVTVPEFTPLGVAWSLAIEVVFYAICWGSMVWGRRRPLAFPVILLGVSAGAVLTARAAGGSWFLFAVSASYLPLLGLGQLTFLLVDRRIRGPLAVMLAGSFWVVYVQGLAVLQPGSLKPGNLLPTSALVAGAAFVLAVLLEGRTTGRPVLRLVATRSYSLYLVHVAGIAVLARINIAHGVPYPVALAAALLVVALLTEACYRLVERPTTRWGARLGASMRRPSRRVEETPRQTARQEV